MNDDRNSIPRINVSTVCYANRVERELALPSLIRLSAFLPDVFVPHGALSPPQD